MAKFPYNPDGERTQGQTAAGDAFYVSQFFVFQPNKLPTKHIFAGDTRVATKTDPMSYQTPVISFYHPDQIGSTSYVSTRAQDLVQHERYFPFGELWRDTDQEECDHGRPDALRREWLFTGKELDWDTGYYYYGARYYDSHSANWLSPDPILASYVHGRPNGGVYVPANLGLYSYAHNNPLIVIDPDGRRIEFAADAASRDAKYQEAFRKSMVEIHKYDKLRLLKGAGYDTVKKLMAAVEDKNGPVVTIHNATKGNDRYDPESRSLYWDPSEVITDIRSNGRRELAGNVPGDKTTISATTLLFHELGHAARHIKDPETVTKMVGQRDDSSRWSNSEEMIVTTRIERNFAAQRHEPLRDTNKGDSSSGFMRVNDAIAKDYGK